MGLLENVWKDNDPTLDALKAEIVIKNDAENAKPRPYLGASGLGNECRRRVWLDFRWASVRKIEADSLMKINDGHRSEDVVAEHLRAVKGIELWTVDPENPEKQIGFLDGHVGGNLDGVIRGLLQAPKTPHVWENKAVNEKKFEKLKELKAKLGEKAALKAWDITYYIQAQLYMHKLGLTRHYLTVCTPGMRDIVSCRTDYDVVDAEKTMALGHQLSTQDTPPERISDRPDYYLCKGFKCSHYSICHEGALPKINCRTCARATATPEGKWVCEVSGAELSYEDQLSGCKLHRYNYEMLPSRKPVRFEGTGDDVVVTYDDGLVDDNKPNLPNVPLPF